MGSGERAVAVSLAPLFIEKDAEQRPCVKQRARQEYFGVERVFAAMQCDRDQAAEDSCCDWEAYPTAPGNGATG